LEIWLPSGAVTVDILPGILPDEAEFVGRNTYDFAIALVLDVSPFDNVARDAKIQERNGGCGCEDRAGVFAEWVEEDVVNDLCHSVGANQHERETPPNQGQAKHATHDLYF